jgi:hypothetical protein
MAQAPLPVPPARAPSKRRRGTLLLLALSGSIAVLGAVAWWALSSGPRDPSPVARTGLGGVVAGPPPPSDGADPPAPAPLDAEGLPSVLPLRNVAARVPDDEREHWSKPRSGATEPWLRVRIVDATTGAPLESAIVRAAASAEALAAQDERVASARADEKGVAQLWDPPSGLGRDLPWLMATAPRHAPALLPVTAAVPSGTHAFDVRGRTIDLPLVVARPLTIRVTGLDERGRSVAIRGARVVARAPWAEEADAFAGDRADAQLRRLLTFEGTTDVQGDASFVPLARQPWRIHVAATGFDSEDLVLTAAQAQVGRVEVALRELWVAAVALPANGLSGCPSLQWDGTPWWYAPAAIQWIPDHLTPEERALATARLARRPDVEESLEPGTELRCRFATLHSDALAYGRPTVAPAQVQTLAGEEPLDVTLSFVPYERFSRDDVFAAHAPPIGGLGRVRFTWTGEPTPPARFVGSLQRYEASDEEILVRDCAYSPHEFTLELPAGHYFLNGSIGGHWLLVDFEVSEGELLGAELSRTSLVSPTGFLSDTVDRTVLAIHDSLGRQRLHYELTMVPSYVPHPRIRFLDLGGSKILTRRSRREPVDPFAIEEKLAMVIERLGIVRTQDLTIEAFGCVPAFFPRVRLDPGPIDLELALDEFATTSW